MHNEETFAPLFRTFGRLRAARFAPPVTIASLALASFVVGRSLNAERKLLLFDLGIGLVFSAALYLVARRLVRAESAHRQRVDAAVVIGTTAAGAVLGVFAMVVFVDKPLGLEKLPQLAAIELLGAISGAAAGFFLAVFTTMIVFALRLFWKRPAPRLDGAVVGGLAGLIGGWLMNDVPHLAYWFPLVATAVGALGGYHGAQLHERRRT